MFTRTNCTINLYFFTGFVTLSQSWLTSFFSCRAVFTKKFLFHLFVSVVIIVIILRILIISRVTGALIIVLRLVFVCMHPFLIIILFRGTATGSNGLLRITEKLGLQLLFYLCHFLFTATGTTSSLYVVECIDLSGRRIGGFRFIELLIYELV